MIEIVNIAAKTNGFTQLSKLFSTGIIANILGFVGAIFLIRAVISLVLNKFQHKGAMGGEGGNSKHSILKHLVIAVVCLFISQFITIVSGAGVNILQALMDWFAGVANGW